MTKDEWPEWGKHIRDDAGEQLKKEYLCEFRPSPCEVKDSQGNHCQNEPKYRYKLVAYLCDQCYANYKRRYPE
mgnify:CR=1 FL=1